MATNWRIVVTAGGITFTANGTTKVAATCDLLMKLAGAIERTKSVQEALQSAYTEALNGNC